MHDVLLDAALLCYKTNFPPYFIIVELLKHLTPEELNQLRLGVHVVGFFTLEYERHKFHGWYILGFGSHDL